jgi:hypothetical protein
MGDDYARCGVKAGIRTGLQACVRAGKCTCPKKLGPRKEFIWKEICEEIGSARGHQNLLTGGLTGIVVGESREQLSVQLAQVFNYV